MKSRTGMNLMTLAFVLSIMLLGACSGLPTPGSEVAEPSDVPVVIANKRVVV